jgi:RNA polymerase II subunit A-like phosphatase
VAEEIFVEADKNDSNTHDSKPHTRTAPNPEFRSDVRTILLPWELPPEQYTHYIQQRNYEQHQYYSQHRISMPPIPDQKLRHFVKLRPHLKEFFDSIQSTYKLSVYTAGTRAYAERIAVVICRHLVGATLDEEGLNALRAKVREKDNEVKRYKAWVGRREQLKLVKEMDEVVESDMPSDNGNTKAKTKGVSFSIGADGDSKDVSMNIDKSKDDSTQMNDEELLSEKANGSLSVVSDKPDSNQSQSIPKRSLSRPEATSDGHIPRKKRKAESDSLISLMAPPSVKEEEEPKDPTEERDTLRKELDEAERLEVEATSHRRKLFGSRIVSRTDVVDLGTDVKSLKRVFPCGGVMVSCLC